MKDEAKERRRELKRCRRVPFLTASFIRNYRIRNNAASVYCDIVRYALTAKNVRKVLYSGEYFFRLSYEDVSSAYCGALNLFSVRRVFQTLFSREMLSKHFIFDKGYYFSLEPLALMDAVEKCRDGELKKTAKKFCNRCIETKNNYVKGKVEEEDMCKWYEIRKNAGKTSLVPKGKYNYREFKRQDRYFRCRATLVKDPIFGEVVDVERVPEKSETDAEKAARRLANYANKNGVFDSAIRVPRRCEKESLKFKKLCRKLEDIYLGTFCNKKRYIMDYSHIYNGNFRQGNWRDVVLGCAGSWRDVERIVLGAMKNFQKMKSGEYEPVGWRKNYLAKDFEKWLYAESYTSRAGRSDFIQCLYEPKKIAACYEEEKIAENAWEKENYEKLLKKYAGIEEGSYSGSMRVLLDCVSGFDEKGKISYMKVWFFGDRLWKWARNFLECGAGGEKRAEESIFHSCGDARIFEIGGRFFSGYPSIVIAKFGLWLVDNKKKRNIQVNNSIFDFERAVKNNGVAKWFLRDLLDENNYPAQYSNCLTIEDNEETFCRVRDGWRGDAVHSYGD